MTVSKTVNCASIILCFVIQLFSKGWIVYGFAQNTIITGNNATRLFDYPSLVNKDNKTIFIIRNILKQEIMDTIVVNPVLPAETIKTNIVAKIKGTEKTTSFKENVNYDPSMTSTKGIASNSFKIQKPSTEEIGYANIQSLDSSAQQTIFNSKSSDDLTLNIDQNEEKQIRNRIRNNRIKKSVDDLTVNVDPKEEKRIRNRIRNNRMKKSSNDLTVNVDPNEEKRIRNRIRMNRMNKQSQMKVADNKDKFRNLADKIELQRSEKSIHINKKYKTAHKRDGFPYKAKSSSRNVRDSGTSNIDIYTYVSAASAFIFTTCLLVMIVILSCFMRSPKKRDNKHHERRGIANRSKSNMNKSSTSQTSLSKSSSSRSSSSRSSSSKSSSRNSTTVDMTEKPSYVSSKKTKAPIKTEIQPIVPNENLVNKKKKVNGSMPHRSHENYTEKAIKKYAINNKLQHSMHRPMFRSKRTRSDLLSKSLKNISSGLHHSSLETLPSLPTILSTSSRGISTSTVD